MELRDWELEVVPQDGVLLIAQSILVDDEEGDLLRTTLGDGFLLPFEDMPHEENSNQRFTGT